MTHMRSQVDMLTTHLVISSLLCSAVIAAFDITNILSIYTFSSPLLQVFLYPFWACTAPSYIKDVKGKAIILIFSYLQ